jgi:hypothetical protein
MRKLALLATTLWIFVSAAARVESAGAGADNAAQAVGGGAGVAAGGSVGAGAGDRDAEVRTFHAAVCAHYGVPDEKVVVIRKRGISDDHLPVVFFVAERAKVQPEVIVELRLHGKSWIDICTRFGITGEVFCVTVAGTYGPPYGKAFGYYRNRPRHEWVALKLTDDEIVGLVNVKLLSARSGLSPDEVMKLRKDGDSFVRLSSVVKDESTKKRAQAESAREAKGKPDAAFKEHSAPPPGGPGGKGAGRGSGKGKRG